MRPTELLIETFDTLDGRQTLGPDATQQAEDGLVASQTFGAAPTAAGEAKSRQSQGRPDSPLAEPGDRPASLESKAESREPLRSGRENTPSQDTNRAEPRAEGKTASNSTVSDQTLKAQSPAQPTPRADQAATQESNPNPQAASTKPSPVTAQASAQSAAAAGTTAGSSAGAISGVSKSTGAVSASSGVASDPLAALKNQRPSVLKAERPPPTPAHEERALTSQVVRGLARVLRDEGGTLTMRLHPRTLGDVTVQLQLREGVVRGEILASDNSARALLTKNVDELVSSLEAKGVTVERLEVKLAEGAASGRNDGAGDRPSFEDGRGSRERGHDHESARRNAHGPGGGDRGPDGEADPDGSNRHAWDPAHGQGRPRASGEAILRLDALI